MLFLTIQLPFVLPVIFVDYTGSIILSISPDSI